MEGRQSLTRLRPQAPDSAGPDPSVLPRNEGRSGVPPLASAGAAFRPRQAPPGGTGAAAQSFQPRSEPPRLTPDRALAATSSEGSTFSPAAAAHPRAPEIVAHEAVHRAQFAAAGQRPAGARPQLEAEARGGARRLMRGQSFQPQFSAPDGAVLAFEYASAGEHLAGFRTWLVDNTLYDADAVDWSTIVTDMLSSTRIYHTDAADEDTAVDLSDKYRYRMLLEIFDQELDAVEQDAEPPTGPAPGLTMPTMEQLEDALFDEYLPTLATGDFAAADVETYSGSFLAHWLGRLGELRFVPDSFDLEVYRPAPRDQQFTDQRLQLLDTWFEDNVQDQMFAFMLDEYARAIGGSQATVTGLPLLMGGGTQRSLTAERWLETLDMTVYRTRLTQHLADQFYAKVATDENFRRLIRTEAEEQSRFRSLATVHWLITRQKTALDEAIEALVNETADELDEFDWEVAGAPAAAYDRMAKVAAATSIFYHDIGPALNNDAALAKVLEALSSALAGIEGLGETWAVALRLGTALKAYKTEIETQKRQIRVDIVARIDVSYDDIAAGIQQMGTYAATWLKETWVPTLHKFALARITANVDLLQDRYDNWTTYTATGADSLEARATVFEDVAEGLRDGTYERVEVGGEFVEPADADRLDDVAAIMRAEAKRLRDPAEAKKRKEKLKQALDGFQDVKARIKSGDVDPTLYGHDVYIEARQYLGLDTFPEYTTYGDIVFGRVTAAENPFLSRLVVGWEIVEKLDRNLKAITILAGLGLITIAGLLAGPAIAAVAGSMGASAATEVAILSAAGKVLFAIDAIIGIGMSVHDVIDAQTLLKLVRLDLDHSVTGVSEEDAERALTMAWVGLALNVLVIAGAVGVGLYFRFLRGGKEVAGLSLKYYQLLREDPALFNSLRTVFKDAAQFDRVLLAAGDATELQTLVQRLDAGFDVSRLERLLSLTEDAGKLRRMLDVTTDASALEAGLGELSFFTGTDEAAFGNFLASSDDITGLLNILYRSEDLPAAESLIASIPDVTRLSAALDLAENAPTLRGLIAKVGSLDRAEALLQGVGAGGGPRLLRVLEMPQAAGLADDAVIALSRMEAAAVDGLAAGNAADVADVATLAKQDAARMSGLFDTYGGAVMEHVASAPYGTVDELETALKRAAKRVTEPQGIFPDTASVPSSWSFQTTRVPDAAGNMVLPIEADGTIVMETVVIAPNGKRGVFERAYNPTTGKFEMRNAFLKDLPQWVPQPTPMTPQGTPTVTYVTLHQMHELGTAYGSVQKFKMSTIQNIDAVLHLQWLRNRYPAASLDVLVAQTHSVRYAESSIVQSGHRIAGVTLDSTNQAAFDKISWLLDHYESQAARGGPAAYAAKVAEHNALLARYGFTRDTEMLMNYDIYINVVPF